MFFFYNLCYLLLRVFVEMMVHMVQKETWSVNHATIGICKGIHIFFIFIFAHSNLLCLSVFRGRKASQVLQDSRGHQEHR